MGYLDLILARQNFGIDIAFFGFFITALLLFTEYNTGSSGESSVILFKRGSKADVVKEAAAAVGDDEEKDQVKAGGLPDEKEMAAADAEAKEALAEQPKMTDVFSWRGINYVIPGAGGESKKLLDDVSGYVAPGKLTALMGESGAGKVCASGDRFCLLC